MNNFAEFLFKRIEAKLDNIRETEEFEIVNSICDDLDQYVVALKNLFKEGEQNELHSEFKSPL
ncbi:hypothetical protein [Bacillus sp. UNC438CL73TsuS30]|uniref:hypothetical protein n=1 Tax=Bacillus sp. UNC438CL73TsuS30 TaxID=1340434 RepID=UPI000478D3F5|nr:hypothetical protein [Bacillus sp. UNC438CL73TsuS30]